MRGWMIVAVLVTAVASGLGCSQGKDPVLAKNGTRVIHASDYIEQYREISPEYRPDVSTPEAKLKFQAMKSALTTLARTPEDPVANSQMGQFLCFVKGNWDLGLRFIAKGSDAALKSIADK